MMISPKLFEDDKKLSRRKESQRKKTSSGMKKRISESRDIEQINQNVEENVASGEKKRGKHTKNKKRKSEQIIEAEVRELGIEDNELEDGANGIRDAEMKEAKQSKSDKKKRRNKKTKAEIHGIEDASKQNKGESCKVRKIKKKERLAHTTEDGFLKNGGEANEDEVYEISSGDEDSSCGMNKWIMEYHQSRPGAQILQQRIDDFIVAHEAQEEQARKERQAQAAEGGWTVVEHHKGRKKTTDAETGITVGSVAQASVMDKMAKKKNNNVGLDFYRFQRREAQRNEIMMLQSKFEQDKKRIQQLRAARKFRPF